MPSAMRHVRDRQVEGLHELSSHLLLGQSPRFGTGSPVGRGVVELPQLSQPLKVMVDSIVFRAHAEQQGHLYGVTVDAPFGVFPVTRRERPAVSAEALNTATRPRIAPVCPRGTNPLQSIGTFALISAVLRETFGRGTITLQFVSLILSSCQLLQESEGLRRAHQGKRPTAGASR